MARRSDHSREELKNIALNAAQTIIKTKGINSLSVRNVTKKNWLHRRNPLSTI